MASTSAFVVPKRCLPATDASESSAASSQKTGDLPHFLVCADHETVTAAILADLHKRFDQRLVICP